MRTTAFAWSARADLAAVQRRRCRGQDREVVLAETAARRPLASEDWRVTEGAQRDDEAERLMLARLVAAPEAWRARATAAGGFLGAAAVVAFWGLTNNSHAVGSGGTAAAALASFFYVVSVSLFLAASVWRSPKPASDKTTNYVASTQKYVEDEAKPIRCLVISGAITAVCALVSTAICSFMLLTTGRDVVVMVSVQEAVDRAAVERLCPGISDPFQGVISSETDGNVVEVRIKSHACGVNNATLALPRESISVLEKSGK